LREAEPFLVEAADLRWNLYRGRDVGWDATKKAKKKERNSGHGWGTRRVPHPAPGQASPATSYTYGNGGKAKIAASSRSEALPMYPWTSTCRNFDTREEDSASTEARLKTTRTD
jgi:hypothetical protein